MNFCTVFDSRYLVQGVTLYRSLGSTCKNFKLYIFCLDKETFRVLSLLNLPNAILLTFEDLNFPELEVAKNNRTWQEFCWTMASCFLFKIVTEYENCAFYVDADMLFCSDPSFLLDLFKDYSILVTKHKFSKLYANQEPVAGTFNVGIIGVRRSAEGISCVTRWYQQCLQECVNDSSNKKCGDQNYLNEWPLLYTSLLILEHIGVNVAPWNIANYNIAVLENKIFINEQPLVCYHYHATRPNITVQNNFNNYFILAEVKFSRDYVLRHTVKQPQLIKNLDLIYGVIKDEIKETMLFLEKASKEST